MDNVFNTATVVLASLLVGIAAGLVWDNLSSYQRRLPYYAGALALGLIAVVIIAAVGNIWLERLMSFAIPLATVAFVVPGLLAPILGRARLAISSWLAPALLVAASAMGIGLVGPGDARSGDLSLPKELRHSPACMACIMW